MAANTTIRCKHEVKDFSSITGKFDVDTTTAELQQPYTDVREHLLNELRWLNGLLAGHV